MAAVPSTMKLKPGDPAPDFSLPSTDGRWMRRNDLLGQKAVLVAFVCNHCPFVLHVRQELAQLGQDLAARGATLVAISANDVKAYPADSFDKMKDFACASGWSFPYLYDESQRVARAYGAACTPDFLLFDGDLRLVYRGQLDDSRPGNGLPVTGRDLRAAVEAALAGRPYDGPQKPSIGCSIKWKAGNEPSDG